jgi:serine/threonine protein kinase
MNVQQDKDTLQQAVPYLKDPKAAAALDLLKRFFDYDPGQRITAMQAMEHQYFKEVPFPLMNVWQDGNGSATGATDPALSYGQRHVHNVGMDGLTMAPQQGSQQQQRGQHHHQQQHHHQHHQQSRQHQQHQQHQQQQMQYNMQYNMQQHDQSMAGQKRAQGGQQYGGQQSKMQRK